MKRDVIYCLSVGLVVTILSMVLLPVSGSEIGWEVGAEYMWINNSTEGFSEEVVEDDLFGSFENCDTMKTMMYYKIIEINESTKEVTYERTSGFYISYTFEITESYNTTEIMRDSNLILVGYTYDEMSDMFVVGDCWVGDIRSLGFFIEPNWVHINNELSNNLNSSKVVGISYYNDTERELTLGEFLSGVPSYKIMGKSNLDEARNEITATTKRWTFEFDLSGYASHSYWDLDIEKRIYTLCNEYSYRFELEYTTEGILKHRLEERKFEYSYNGKTLASVLLFEYILDGFEDKGGSSDSIDGLEFTTVLITAIFIPVSAYVWRKRNNKLMY